MTGCRKRLAGQALALLVIPMLGPRCDGKEYTFYDQQFVWVRANNTDATNAITVVRGSTIYHYTNAGQRLCLVSSACEAYANWPDNFDCTQSRITLYLIEGVEYDVTGWSEPADRRSPDRNLTVFRESWTCCD